MKKNNGIKCSSSLTRVVLVFVIMLYTKLSQGSTTLPELLQELNETKIKALLPFHPVHKITQFKQEQFKNKIKEQQGNFDQKIYSQFMNKNDISFLPDYQFGLSQQLENGISWKGGYKNEATLSTLSTLKQTMATVKDVSSTFLEVTIPLLRGFGANNLLLQQVVAQMNAVIGDFEQTQIILSLRQQTFNAFYEWQSQLMLVLIEYQSCDITRMRLKAITKRADAGDIPLIDITETQQELKKREKDLNKALNNYEKSRLYLQSFLWNQYGLPLFENTTFPNLNLADNVTLNQLIAWKKNDLLKLELEEIPRFQSLEKLEKHPENQIIVKTLELLKQSIGQLEQLEKPTLNLRMQPKYQLQKQQVDYEVGLEFSYPLFNRSNQAKTEYAKLEQTVFQIKRQEKKQKLELLLEKTNISLLQIQERFNIALTEQQLAQTMLDAEQTKFQLGDSTIFLLNRREREIFDVYRNLVQTWLEHKQAQMELNYLLGRY